MPSGDPMDVGAAIELLRRALPLQFRSALQYATAAATIEGLASMGLAERFHAYAELELADARRLVEKLVAIGGEPTTSVAPWTATGNADGAVRGLISSEREAIAALHAVIPTTGQEPRSEALEHLVEHLIIRKQEQLDTLLRAVGETGGSRLREGDAPGVE